MDKVRPSPSLLSSAVASVTSKPSPPLPGAAFVEQVLLDLLAKLPDATPIFGALDTTGASLKMPRSSTSSQQKTYGDNRQASWEKKLTSIAKQTMNYPNSIDDCWFIRANKEDGYHEIKLCKHGSTGKFRTARALRILLEPGVYGEVTNRSSQMHAIHRCGNGKARGKLGACCINPYHIYFGPNQLNQDTKGCKYGATWLCPHKVKCVFTWSDTGLVKECFTYPSINLVPKTCPHNRKCNHQVDEVQLTVVTTTSSNTTKEEEKEEEEEEDIVIEDDDY